jgi:hypothetical protein
MTYWRLDMTGNELGFSERNWVLLMSVSSVLRHESSWKSATQQLDVPKEFLCSIVAALRAYEDAHSNEIASNAISCILRDGVAMAYASTLDMEGSLREMHASLSLATVEPTMYAETVTVEWALPVAVSTMIIGRAVDPLGDLTLPQMAVVAAICLKLSDRAFGGVVVSMEHLIDPLIATGPCAERWAPSRLVIIVGTHITSLLLVSGMHLHDLLGEQMRDALRDALARTDACTGQLLADFLQRLSRAICNGTDSTQRVFCPLF